MFGEDEATPNYKKFFNFIKSTKCERTNVAPLKREGFLHHDATTKANILNQQFASVFTEEDIDNLPDLGISSTPEMNKITINTEGAQNLLQHLLIFLLILNRKFNCLKHLLYLTIFFN